MGRSKTKSPTHKPDRASTVHPTNTKHSQPDDAVIDLTHSGDECPLEGRTRSRVQPITLSPDSDHSSPTPTLTPTPPLVCDLTTTPIKVLRGTTPKKRLESEACVPLTPLATTQQKDEEDGTVVACTPPPTKTATATKLKQQPQPQPPKPTNSQLQSQPKTNQKQQQQQPNNPKPFRNPTLPRTHEERVQKQGFTSIAGVDEAGRGPLAGPVVAAACVVPPHVHIEGVNDSKMLNESERERVFEALTNHPEVKYGVGVVDHKTIDEINILQATMRAMTEAVDKLEEQPDYVFVDGNRCPPPLRANGRKAETMIRGDSKCFSIAAASVIAKVTRDRMMQTIDKQYPEYGFAQHKGYGTAYHREAIARHGPCPLHRLTFAPCNAVRRVSSPPTAHKRKRVCAGDGAEDGAEDGGRKRRRL